MNLDVCDDYGISSDSRCWQVYKWKTPQTGESVGEKYSEPLTYHSSFESALESLRQRLIRESDAITVTEALSDINIISRAIAEASVLVAA